MPKIHRKKSLTTLKRRDATTSKRSDSTNALDDLESLLRSPRRRFRELYHVKNKDGIKVPFTPWSEQQAFFDSMHYLNIYLKARQRGITTGIQLFMLDCCLFNDNINAGVIAHNREDAQKFFKDKIKFAYDNLPEALRAACPARSDNANELTFENGSSIRVGTSMRSGTLQYLHISEYGKICAKYPDKAKEIKTGSLNTVAQGNFVFIESTAEGAHGHFYELCQIAEKHQLSQEPLTNADYKFSFYPWWNAPEYRLSERDTQLTRIDDEMQRYFEMLDTEHDIKLDAQQKAWYVKKRQEQGEVEMTQEYPSFSEEAFQGVVEGAIYGKQIRQARKDQRIGRVPVSPVAEVNTFWDIGRDMTSIWFHQRIGSENRFIDYYEESGRELAHFAWLLLRDRNSRFHRYHYGTHYFPHDIGETDYSVSETKTRQEIAESLGLKPLRRVPRILSIEEGLEMTRQAIATCTFDEVRCEQGLKCLENYRYEYDEKLEVYKRLPLHNWASHGADSFRQFAQGYRNARYYHPRTQNEDPLARETRRKHHANSESDWRI